MSAAQRARGNPILTPASIPPSHPDLEVVGVFNPAAIALGDQTCLLLRVAEAPREVASHEVAAPLMDPQSGQLRIERWPRDAPGIDASDAREVVVGGDTYLTSISHLRLARSSDGLQFEVAPEPCLAPQTADESFGVEDPRITEVDGEILVNYSAVSPRGIATALAVAKGRDLARLERRGIAFAPNNRDVTIFPERVGGELVALHRPMPAGLGSPAIWLARSPDGLCWGDHRFVAGRRPGRWDDLKIGGGAPPFRVEGGWLAIYHGVTADPPTYSLGALLLDPADPSRVLGRSREPILAPEAPYEVDGFYGNVVFTCGALLSGDRVRIYYGAADGVTAAADLSLAGILAGLE